ncbi:DUF7344 domain-containing protein [Halorarius litoreus]|uniref:DUF7344 domain-containing protein n=1 Tax=Halorarius litoreus TaxID=2962676 RepID=UPI0020CD4952|nr:hypothetical protein [Halorarius litoreus]
MSHEPRADDESTADQPRPATTAACFDLLGRWERRFVLVYLSRAAEPVTLDRLADALAATDDGLTVEDARLQLYHLHLPKLAAAGVVVYDRTAETVVVSAASSEPGATASRVAVAVSELRARSESHG